MNEGTFLCFVCMEESFLRVERRKFFQGGLEFNSHDTANYIRVDPHALSVYQLKKSRSGRERMER